MEFQFCVLIAYIYAKNERVEMKIRLLSDKVSRSANWTRELLNAKYWIMRTHGIPLWPRTTYWLPPAILCSYALYGNCRDPVPRRYFYYSEQLMTDVAVPKYHKVLGACTGYA